MNSTDLNFFLKKLCFTQLYNKKKLKKYWMKLKGKKLITKKDTWNWPRWPSTPRP